MGKTSTDLARSGPLRKCSAVAGGDTLCLAPRMSRAAWVGLAFAVASRAAAAGVPLVVSAETTFGEDLGVVLTIENGEVIYERAPSGGAAPRFGAGFAHWR